VKPFSQSCENNKDPILAVLRDVFAETQSVLEIGSGTGQHACYFAGRMPQLCWQPSDQAEYLPGIRSWIEAYRGDNLLPALELDVRQEAWPNVPEAVFTANSLHIMAFSAVEILFRRLGELAPSGNVLCVYGPFNYGGDYSSESNARFDVWLARQNAASAIRDFEVVDALALAAGYRLAADHTMPANNRLLQWIKA
jgi:hypothetical protein